MEPTLSSSPRAASPVLLERREHVLIVTLNRPEVRNACDLDTAFGVAEAMDLLDADDDLFVGIITGAGGNFSAGADLKEAARGALRERPARGGFGIFKRPPRKPLIAAVEGFAVGGGLEVCLACDLVVAARDARMGLPEVRHNLVAVGGALFRLPRRIPYNIAMELALCGDLRNADFFEKLGLINRMTEPGQALEKALELAQRILVNGPTALAATKEILYQGVNWSEDEAWDKQAALAQRAIDSEDFREGLSAFSQKRKPLWRGR